jgi:hypothetical protein
MGAYTLTSLQSQRGLEPKAQRRLGTQLNRRSLGHGLDAGSRCRADYGSDGGTLSSANDRADNSADACPSGNRSGCIPVSGRSPF